MKTRLLFIILFYSLCCSNITKANTLGFGITGGYGLNYSGFSGVRDGVKSESDIGQNFSGGVFIEYNIGKKNNQEPIALSLNIAYKKRELYAAFPDNKNNKSPRYYSKILKTITMECIDAYLTFFSEILRFDHGVFGTYIGFGGYYMIEGSHSNRFIEPTHKQRKDIKTNLENFNAFALMGLKSKFLDNILSISLDINYSFINQYKNSKNTNNRLLKEYESLSIGNGTIDINAKLGIDIWQMIIG